jgi:SOS response regulatory protein OraA/RecX
MDEKLYTKALKYLSRRPRSEKEVREHLIGKKNLYKFKSRHSSAIESGLTRSYRGLQPLQDDINDIFKKIDLIIDVLKEQRFLNDEDFVVWWVDQRTRFKAKGWRAIAFELKQKGISEELIKKQRATSNQDLENNRNEKEIALSLVQKRIKKYEGMPKDELYSKLGGFLARRGFDMDVIRACIDEVLRKSV